MLLDGCRCHAVDGIRDEFEQNKIVLLLLPPHTSDQIQALDLGIFGVFKLYSQKQLNMQTYERQTAQVIKMCDAWQRATIPRNVVNAFRAAGLVPVTGEGKRIDLQCSEEAATHIRQSPEEEQARPFDVSPVPIRPNVERVQNRFAETETPEEREERLLRPREEIEAKCIGFHGKRRRRLPYPSPLSRDSKLGMFGNFTQRLRGVLTIERNSLGLTS
jgi:hypothetical protein